MGFKFFLKGYLPFRIILTSAFLLIAFISSAQKYWVGTGNWSAGANWSNAPGGAGGAGAPGAGETAVFDGGGTGNCIVDINPNVLSIEMRVGYTGTVSQNANITVEAGGFIQSAGTFLGSTQLININGPLTLNGGTFISTSGTLTVLQDFSLSGISTFNHNSGVTNFLNTIATNISISGSPVFYRLTFTSNGPGLTVALTNDITVENLLTFTGNSFVRINNQGIIQLGDVQLSSTNVNGGGTGRIEFINGIDQTITSNVGDGFSRLPNVIINKTGGKIILVGSVSLNGALQNQSATEIRGSGTMVLANAPSNTISGIPFIINRVKYISTGNYITNTDFTIDSLLILGGTLGYNLNGVGRNIECKGDISITNTSPNTNTPGTATILINGTGNQTSTGTLLFGAGALPNVTINKPSGVITLVNVTNISGTWNYIIGDLVGSGTVAFIRANTVNGPTHTLNNVTFYTNSTFFNFTLNCDLIIEGELRFEGGATGNNFTFGGIGNLYAKGNILLNNVATAGNGGGTANIFIDGILGQSIISSVNCGASKLPNIVINKPSGILDFQGEISAAGNWDYIQGTVNPGTSTVCFTQNRTLDAQGIIQTMAFYNARLADVNRRTLLGDIIVNNQLNLGTGNILMNTHDIYLKNPLPIGITRTSGYIVSETDPIAGYGRLIWNIRNSGAGNNYVVPFGTTAGVYIPVNYNIQTAGAETDTGKVIFATYPTVAGNNPNNRPLPTGVTNFNDYYNVENAPNALDRFWIIDTINYASPPAAHLLLSYRDAEWNTATNALVVANLKIQRWNAPYWAIPYPTTLDATLNRATSVNPISEFSVFTLATNPIPTIGITASDSTLCPGDCIDFTQSTNPDGTSWQWSFPGATPSSSTAKNPINICYGVTSPNDVSLRVTYPSGVFTSQTKPGYIVVNPAPIAVAGPDTVVCEGAEVPLFAGGGVTYEWSPANTLNNPNIANPISNPTATTTYSVIVTDANGCKDTADVSVTATPSTLALVMGIVDEISCPGASDGKVFATISGGSSPYRFAWSNGDNRPFSPVTSDSTDTGLISGTYSVTVTDNIGCGKIESITINDPAAIVIDNVAFTDASCFGATDGTITITASGGTGTLQYNRGTGNQANGNFSGLAADTYTITITDSKGCSVTETVAIDESDELSIDNITVVDPTCFSAGSITIDASGGSGIFQYSINAVDYFSSNVFIGLQPNTYDVTVRDSNATICTATQQVTLQGPPAVVIDNIAIVNVSCNGGSDGSITVTASGGTGAGFDYSFDGGANYGSSNIATGLPFGTYEVYVRDQQDSCTANQSVSITEPTSVVIDNITVADVTCFGASDGTITVTASGGTGNLEYSFDGGTNYGVSNTATGLSANSYDVFVRDENNCTANQTVTITEPTQLIINNIVSTDITCNGANDGTITVTASGGTGTLEYSFDGGTNYGASNTATGLSANTYTVFVRDENNCTTNQSVSITEPTAVVIDNIATTNITCNGANDGSITVTASGGTGNLEYSFDGGNIYDTQNTTTGLSANTYDVFVRDENNCTANQSVTITEPSPVVIDNITVTDVTCFGATDGTITATASGGTGILEYSFDGGLNYGTSSVATGLPANSYDVFVRDENNCTANQTVTVNAPVATLTIDNIVSTNITCNGVNDGTITVTASGGTGTLEYSFDGGTNYGASNTATGLSPNSYDIFVIDENNCTANQTVTITEPVQLIIDNIASTDITCNGANDGTITVTSSGGTGTLEYSFDGGLNYGTANSATGLSANTYDVFVIDENNCTANQSVTITEPTAIVIDNIATTDITCNGANDGTITVTASGGTGILEYSFDGGTNYGTTNTANGLPANNFDVFVRDENNCTANQTVTITEPASLEIDNIATTDVSCNGATDGTITVTASGGTGNLEYSFDGGTNYGTSNTATGLSANSYDVFVIDENNCTANQSVTIIEPSAITIDNIVSNNISCNGANDGTITVIASGGTGTLEYSFDGGTNYGTSNTTAGLSANTYDVFVRDENNCTANQSVTITEPTAIVIDNIATTDITCNGANDGTITVTASGGTGILEYSFDGGTNYGTTNTANGLPANNFDVFVRDENNCTANQTVTITEPTQLLIDNITVTDVSCFGASDGTITVTASGGTGSLEYSFDAGTNYGTANSATVLSANTYDVFVRDENNCTTNQSVSITEPTAVVIDNIATTDITCNGANDGTITVTASGGTGTLEYSFDGGTNYGTSNNATGLSANSYDVFVIDENNCTANQSVTIIEPSAITIDNIVSNNISCNGANDGTITVIASGGTGNLEYSFDGGTNYGSTNIANGLPPNNYDVFVRDENNCTANQSVSITEPTLVVIDNITVTDVTCFGATDGSITVTASGGTGILEYSFDGGTTYNISNIATGLSANTYDVFVRDENNCTANQSVSISEPSLVVIDNIATTNLTCGGANDGTITVTASGGTGILEYSFDGGNNYAAQNTATGLSANTYDVFVRDENNCIANQSLSITEPTAVVIDNSATTNITCNGANDGTITVTASGGTGNLEYSFDGGNTYNTPNSATGLSANTYDVFVRDENNCTANQSVSITEPTLLVIDNIAATDVTCFGATDGTIIVTASGGTGILEYSFDGGLNYGTSNAATGLPANSYDVFVRDENNCTANQSVSIIEPGAITVTAVLDNDISCFNANDAEITAAASGGASATYDYEIAGIATNTTGVFNGLPSGTYEVIATDVNGCTAVSNSITITNPSEITVTAVLDNDISCFNANDAQITVTASGGTGALEYSIDGGLIYQVSEIFSGLSDGTYTFTIRDANNCTAISNSVTVANPSELTVSMVLDNDITCNNDNDAQITATGNGGTGALEYSIDGVNFDPNNVFSSLSEGFYEVTVRDDNGCTASDNFGFGITVTNPQEVGVSLAVFDDPCQDGGSINASGFGGYPGYEYSIDSGNTFSTNNTFSSLPIGTYVITVRDINGCIGESNPVTFVELDLLTGTATLDNDITCFNANDARITIDVNGGNPFTGNQYGYEDAASGIPFTGSTFPLQLTDLSEGTYVFTITDLEGCTITLDPIIVINPLELTISATLDNDITCFNDNDAQITASGNGGTGVLEYSIDGTNFFANNVFSALSEGVYEVTVRDENACQDLSTPITVTNPNEIIVSAVLDNDITCFNANDAQITATASGGASVTYDYEIVNIASNQTGIFSALPSGFYEVIAKDANGCTAISNTVTVINPDEVIVNATLDNDITCHNANDAQITVTASGGTGQGFTYSIDGNNYVANNVFTGLAGNTYTLYAQDDANCIGTFSTTITVLNPSLLEVTAVLNNDITCFNANDAQITATATGGTASGGNYNYEITGGNTNATGLFTALQEGTYEVTATDDNGCTAVSNSIVVANPAELIATIANQTNVNCFGGSDGTATVSATGGTVAASSSYQYFWNDVNAQITATAVTLSAGTYNVEVRDDNACVATASVTITEPATPVSASIVVDDNVSCFGGSNGAATVSATGGTVANDYQYLWSANAQNQITATASGLPAGTYFVTVIDDNGCEDSDSVVITQPELLIPVVQLDSNAYCNGNGNGQLTVWVRGGTAPFDYDWGVQSTTASPDTFNVATDLTAGSYTVVVTDANGCSATRNGQVGERPGPTIDANSIQQSYCNRADGSISITASSNDTPLTYSWSHDTGLNSSFATGLFAGTYTVTVTDLATCEETLTLSFVDIEGPKISGALVKDAYCDNDNGTIILEVFDGTLPYTYEWSHFYLEEDSIVKRLPPGQYTVTVTDAAGCDTTASYVITNIAAPMIAIEQSSPQQLLLGEELLLSVDLISAFDSVTYRWIPSRGLDADDVDSVLASPDRTTVYQVIVTDVATGCDARDTITVIVRDEENIFIPNAITPNGDGVNDVWRIRALAELPNNEVMIINRWGDEVFKAKPYNNDWDGTYKGKQLPGGTYYYILILDDLKEVKDGSITIIR